MHLILQQKQYNSRGVTEAVPTGREADQAHDFLTLSLFFPATVPAHPGSEPLYKKMTSVALPSSSLHSDHLDMIKKQVRPTEQTMHILIRKAISTWTKRHWGRQTLCHFRAIRDSCPLFSVCVKLHLYSTGRKKPNRKEEKNPTTLFLGNVSSNMSKAPFVHWCQVPCLFLTMAMSVFSHHHLTGPAVHGGWPDTFMTSYFSDILVLI